MRPRCGQDWTAGYKWHEAAAAFGLARAMFNCGAHCLAGKGTPKDAAKAAEWFRLAADKGMAEAASNLGEMHRAGLLLSSSLLSSLSSSPPPSAREQERRFDEARRWHSKAASLGHAFSQQLLEDDRHFTPDQDDAEAYGKAGGKQGVVHK